jgi:hypothetical protein
LLNNFIYFCQYQINGAAAWFVAHFMISAFFIYNCLLFVFEKAAKDAYNPALELLVGDLHPWQKEGPR